MHTTFHVDFWNEEGGSLGFASLEVDLPFAPTPDIEFEHPVWHEGRKGFVSYNIETGTFYVVFERDMLTNKAALQQHADMYKGHGWTVT